MIVIVAAAAIAVLNRHEPPPVIAILIAPVALLIWRFRCPAPDTRQRPHKSRARWLTLALGAAVAFIMHRQMQHMLGGFIRPAELAWSIWFVIGCLAILELLVLATRRWIDRWRRGRTAGHALRLILLVAIALPAGAAAIQTVRVKIGYDPAPLTTAGAVTFTATTDDGLHIRGYFIDRGHDTTLVTTHGLGAHAENFAPYLLEQIGRLPVNGLIFDMRGHGYSDGHVTSFGYHEQADVRAALDWLAQNHPRASRRLAFYLFSMGSAAALPLAAESPSTAAVAIDSGFARLTDVARGIADQLHPAVAPYLDHAGTAAASVITLAPLWRVEPIRSVETLHESGVPIIVMHGGADIMIDPHQGDLLREAAGGRGRTVTGGAHTSLPLADSTYNDTITDFFRAALPELARPTGDARP